MTEQVASHAGPKASWIHRRWVPWTAGALAFGLTFLIGGALVADWTARVVQMQALLDRVEASEAVMGELQDEVAEAFEDHGGDGDNAKLDGELRALAAQAEIDLTDAGQAVADLPIAVWHVDLERARDAYLLHNYAWQDYMARASESSSEFLRPQPDVNQTFFDAQQPFIDAIPDPDTEGLIDRVIAIFAPPEGSSSGGMQT